MKLMDRVREAIRLRHYALSTERSYCHWVRRYIIFHNRQHPEALSSVEVKAFLTHLANRERVSASTQNQALCALIFLYKQVLGIELGDIGGFKFAKKPRRMPTVLSRMEVQSVLSRMHGTNKVVATLLYGAGLRKMEALRLRIGDLNFDRKEMLIRNAKGGKDRVTVLPESCVAPLKGIIESSRLWFEADMQEGLSHDLHPCAESRGAGSVESGRPTELRIAPWIILPGKQGDTHLQGLEQVR
jgi:integrase